MAIGINHNDLADVVDEMQTVLNQLQLAVKEINPDYELNLYETEGSKILKQNILDYTVSSTHTSSIQQYFQNKTYATQDEMVADVKIVLYEMADIDLNDYPLAMGILDNLDQSEVMMSNLNKMFTSMEEYAQSLQK